MFLLSKILQLYSWFTNVYSGHLPIGVLLPYSPDIAIYFFCLSFLKTLFPRVGLLDWSSSSFLFISRFSIFWVFFWLYFWLLHAFFRKVASYSLSIFPASYLHSGTFSCFCHCCLLSFLFWSSILYVLLWYLFRLDSFPSLDPASENNIEVHNVWESSW